MPTSFANAVTKFEYKAVLLPSYKENIADTARLKELADELTKSGAEYWEPLDLSKHLPGGYVMLRRSLDAPSTIAKRRSPWGLPVTKASAPAAVASVVVPAVAAALNPTAGKTDARATA